MMELPVIRVQMLGTEKITYGDTPILYGRNSVTKAMNLLLILFFHGKNGIARNKLLEDLYGRDDLLDIANNLRVTIHRMKKMLIQAGLPEYEYIKINGGRYYWNGPMEIEVDVHVFSDLVEKAVAETNMDKKLTMLKRACEMYDGEFLQKLSGDEWVLVESIRLKKLYFSALQQLSNIMLAKRQYKELLYFVEPACEIYPFDEWQSVKIDCYIGMNHYKDALKEYETTAKLLFEELGVSPSEKMLEQFQKMSEHIRNRPQVIGEIQGNLRENSSEKGAFFCTFPGFRDAYRMMRRGMERSGQSVFLLVCTLTDSKGHPMEESERLDEMSMELHRAIKSSLRSSDSFTQYNKSQYLVMLVGTNEENCQIAIRRIIGNFSKVHKSWADRLQCNVSSLWDVME